MPGCAAKSEIYYTYIVSRVGLQLALRSHHRCARDHDAGSTAMVPHGQMEPIGLEGILLATKHDSDVRGVFTRGIKICVVPNLCRQVHPDTFLRDEGPLPESSILLQKGLPFREHLADGLTGGRPDTAGMCHVGIQCRFIKATGIKAVACVRVIFFFAECVCVLCEVCDLFVLFPPPSLPEDTLLSQDRQIQYPLPNRHPDACLCVGRGKDAVRQVVVGEVMVGGDGKEAFVVVGGRHDL